MHKILIRIGAFLLIPCLIADPSFAVGLTSFESGFIAETNLNRSSLMMEQAVSVPQQEFEQNLEFSRTAHHLQSNLAHRLTISGIPLIAGGIGPEAEILKAAGDGQRITIEFPGEMSVEETNKKGLLELSGIANAVHPRKTFEIVRLASEENPHSVEIIVHQRIWEMDTSRDGYDQLLEFTAKQLKVRGANRDKTDIIPYFRTTEHGDTVAWYLHYPDGSQEVVYGSVSLEKQKRADMMIWAIAERAKRTGYDAASKGTGAKAPVKRLADDAPSMFDTKNVDGDPTELAMIWTASSGRQWAIMGNPFPLWPPKESLSPGEMQALHFTVSRYAPPLTDDHQRQKNIGSEENNEDMAELAAYLNHDLNGRPAIWTVANGWYPNDDPSVTLKAGVTQSVAHFQIGNQRFPIENMSHVDHTGAAGPIQVGVIRKSNGFASALVFDAPDENIKAVPALAAAAIQQMRERGHTFNVFYSKKDSGGWRVFVYDRTVGVPELFSNEWAYAELSQAIAGDDIMRLFQLTPEQLEEFRAIDAKNETAQKKWVKDHRKKLTLRPDIWDDIKQTLHEVSAPDEEVTAIAAKITGSPAGSRPLATGGRNSGEATISPAVPGAVGTATGGIFGIPFVRIYEQLQDWGVPLWVIHIFIAPVLQTVVLKGIFVVLPIVSTVLITGDPSQGVAYGLVGGLIGSFVYSSSLIHPDVYIGRNPNPEPATPYNRFGLFVKDVIEWIALTGATMYAMIQQNEILLSEPFKNYSILHLNFLNVGMLEGLAVATGIYVLFNLVKLIFDEGALGTATRRSRSNPPTATLAEFAQAA